MSAAKILNKFPVSGSTPEYRFGEIGLAVVWIEFYRNDLSKWFGSFSIGYNGQYKLIELEKNEFLILAGGNLFFINANTNLQKNEYYLEDVFVLESINDNECLIIDDSKFLLFNQFKGFKTIRNFQSISWIKPPKIEKTMKI